MYRSIEFELRRKQNCPILCCLSCCAVITRCSAAVREACVTGRESSQGGVTCCTPALHHQTIVVIAKHLPPNHKTAKNIFSEIIRHSSKYVKKHHSVFSCLVLFMAWNWSGAPAPALCSHSTNRLAAPVPERVSTESKYGLRFSLTVGQIIN